MGVLDMQEVVAPKPIQPSFEIPGCGHCLFWVAKSGKVMCLECDMRPPAALAAIKCRLAVTTEGIEIHPRDGWSPGGCIPLAVGDQNLEIPSAELVESGSLEVWFDSLTNKTEKIFELQEQRLPTSTVATSSSIERKKSKSETLALEMSFE